MLPEKCSTILQATIGGNTDMYLVERSTLNHCLLWQFGSLKRLPVSLCSQRETPQITFSAKKDDIFFSFLSFKFLLECS